MKRLLLLCFILLVAALAPWSRVEHLLDITASRFGLWIGGACIVGVVVVYIDITISGLRQPPPHV